jgi:hypothetical protein
MKRQLERWEIVMVSLVLVAGIVLRARLAIQVAFNPDEALHAVLAFGTWSQTLRNSLLVTHPPLLAVITYLVSRVSHGELALRMVPMVAGSLFPVLLFVWVRRVAGELAALGAFVLLTLSPNLIALSAQLRSYTLALLFFAAALVVLEEALARARWPWMALYSVLLLLCIASDYSMAWFVGGAGVYALSRLRGASSAVKAVWAAGQAAAVVLYGWLYVIQVRRFRGSGVEADAVTRWLRGGFPKPGGLLLFPVANTVKQFKYLTGSTAAGGVAFLLFAVAIVLLWRSRKTRALAALLTFPFLLSMAGAYVRVFPYGATRHTVVLGVLGAICIATLLETVPRRMGMAMVGGMLVAGLLWQLQPSTETFLMSRNEMRQCVDYMRTAIPPGTLVFTDQAIVHLLSYYARDTEPQTPATPKHRFVENLVDGRWRLAIRDYQYDSQAQYEAALEAFRRQYGIAENEPVWVVDGGWVMVSGQPDDRQPFSRVMRVFQAGL